MEYFIAVLKYWKWLVVDWILAILTAFFTILGKPVPFGFSLSVFIILAGFVGAQYFTYRDLRKEKTKLEDDLKDVKLYKEKDQRIQIISKEKYPSEVLRILDGMRKNLDNIVNGAEEVKNVTLGKMSQCNHGDPHELYLATHQKTLDDNVHCSYYFYQKWTNDISLKALQQNNSYWTKLVDDLETVKKDVPDQKLKEYILSHVLALNGSYAIFLFYHYLAKYGSNGILMAGIEPFRPHIGLLDETLTRVTNRIYELKLGEQPKWQTLYYEQR